MSYIIKSLHLFFATVLSITLSNPINCADNGSLWAKFGSEIATTTGVVVGAWLGYDLAMRDTARVNPNSDQTILKKIKINNDESKQLTQKIKSKKISEKK